MIYLLLIILFAAGAFLIFLANLNGEYEVRRSRVFAQDMTAVFDKLRDFHSWPEWNPWLAHEPETNLTFSDNAREEGGYYTWDGKIVGAGKLTHLKFDHPNLIEQRLEFTRPFKNTCSVRFELQPEADKTQVQWIMNAKMPFFFRFMVPKMKKMIEQDYDLGLAMLAGALDPTAEHPKINYLGETQLSGTNCLCKAFAGDLPAMQSAMEQGFPELLAYVQQHNGEITAEPRAFYHKADIKTMYFECDMAIPVTEGIPTGDYTLKQLGAGKHYQVEVWGSYDFLELAWYAAMAHIYMLKLKADPSRPSIETYTTDTESVSHSNEIKTVLSIPIK